MGQVGGQGRGVGGMEVSSRNDTWTHFRSAGGTGGTSVGRGHLAGWGWCLVAWGIGGDSGEDSVGTRCHFSGHSVWGLSGHSD